MTRPPAAVLARLREQTAELPADASPPIAEARQRALRAVETTAAALKIDPTLADDDRDRDIHLLGEILRQVKPLSRQAEVLLEHRRLSELPEPNDRSSAWDASTP